MRRAAVVVACLVVLAGCSFVTGGGGEAGPTQTPRPDGTAPPGDSPTPGDGPGTPAASATATPGAPVGSDSPTARPTPTATPTPEPRHPWAGEVVTVAVVDEMPGPRDSRPTIGEAAAAWNGTEVEGGTVRFRVVEGSTAPDADLTITVQPTVETCGEDVATDTFQYCMPRVQPGSDATRSGTLSGRYSNETFQRIVTGSFALLVNRDPDGTQYLPVEDPTYADPWPAAHPVVVGVENHANESRNVTRLTRQALAWWDERPRSEKDYTTEFVVRPDAPEPDLTVELVDEIETCGVEDDTLIVGCADLLSASELADDPTVRIEAGYTDASTVQVLKHEFGHIYGRSHGQEPLPLMNETTPVVTWPRPNATERPLPWRNDTLAVYLDASGVDGSEAWDDVQPALDYYEGGADGWLEAEVTLVRTRNRSAADIVITVTEPGACGFENGGVCDIVTRGVDTDGDDAFEYYTGASMTVTVSGDTERAWFAGYGLGFAMGAESGSDMPPPLQDRGNSDEEWWE